MSGIAPAHRQRGRDRRNRPDFDPADHERELVAILAEIARAPDLDARELDRCLKRHPKDGRGLFSRSELIAGYRRFAERERWDLGESDLAERLRLRPVRSSSGVTPVTVLTRPHPCPGRCIFCPSDVRMPKSYLSDEPGAQRAEDNGFDPYLQTWNRLAALRAIGHPLDKVELIVLGGTWSSHPEAYQVAFVTRCLEALNDFGRGEDGRGACGAPGSRFAALRSRRRVPGGDSYNRIVSRALAAAASPAWEAGDWERLRAAQRENETAGSRCVGLVVETRPDHVSESELLRIRRLGATKVQLGIQSLSDAVLARSRRGHDVDATRRAIALLRRAGFKIQGHWMANLPGSTPQDDVADFARLFDDPDFRPDELKLYPCSLVESADLMTSFAQGDWRPYADDELLEVVCECLARTPRTCRLTRVIRDFSAADIVAGSRVANLREVAERRLAGQGRAVRDIRAREVRDREVDPRGLSLRETRYRTSAGEERFLELATPDDRLAGFLRLLLPREPSFVEELGAAALVRELHVYGASLSLGRRVRGAAQHAGLGRRLLEAACRRAAEAGRERLAVISAVGTRAYYRARGFEDGELYQTRQLERRAGRASGP